MIDDLTEYVLFNKFALNITRGSTFHVLSDSLVPKFVHLLSAFSGTERVVSRLWFTRISASLFLELKMGIRVLKMKRYVR